MTDSFTKELRIALAPFGIPYHAAGIGWAAFERQSERKNNTDLASMENKARDIAERYKRVYPCMVKESNNG